MKNMRILCLFAVFFLLAPCLVFSDEDGQGNSRKEETTEFRASRMKGNTAKGSEYTELEGDAWCKSDTIEIYADKITMNGTDFRFISASGSVRGTDLENGFSFSCDTLFYDRDEKNVRFEGSVIMDDTENDVKASAHIIEYDQNSQVAVMQIDVSIAQKETICTSAFAVYWRERELLDLLGNPLVVRGGDTFRGQEIQVNLDTEEIIMQGNVRGSITDTGEKK